MSVVREFLGSGSFGGGILNGGAGIQIFPSEYGAMLLVLPFGGFLMLGSLIALVSGPCGGLRRKRTRRWRNNGSHPNFFHRLGRHFVENFILVQFLGICPFMGVSKKMDTATRHGPRGHLVMGLASISAGWSMSTCWCPWGWSTSRPWPTSW